jgi:hypothetical protein
MVSDPNTAVISDIPILHMQYRNFDTFCVVNVVIYMM